MNERIRKLANVWANRRAEDEKLGIVYTFSEPALEQFAQLIVRECIQNIRDNMEIAKVDTIGDKDLFLETLRTSGHFYITELEQHFGVDI